MYIYIHIGIYSHIENHRVETTCIYIYMYIYIEYHKIEIHKRSAHDWVYTVKHCRADL